MDEEHTNKMTFDLVSLLYKWLGPRRILAILAEIEEELSRTRWETGEYWNARHNAKLLQKIASELRGR